MTAEPVPFTPTSSRVPAEPSNILHVFERALRDVSLPIDRAREIYNLQREIEFDLAEREYIRVRSLVERELEPVARDASNPQTRSKYATLAQVIQAVRPVYSKHGIVVEFDSGQIPQDGWIRVLALVSHEGGYKRTYHIDMPADGKGAQGRDVMTRTHATGSAVTYGRRYLLLMIFNIAVGGEDDDGNAANGSTGPQSSDEFYVTPEQVAELERLLALTGRSVELFCKKFYLQGIGHLPASKYKLAVDFLNQFIPKARS